ncbi:MAG: Maf family protein, partial [bacterium]
LVLASGSPRRQALFRSLGLDFSVHVPAIDENFTPGQPPEKIVIELAKSKAKVAATTFSNACVVSADTIVVLSGQILGKPRDASDAENMLQKLSGKTHEVFTGYAIVTTPENEMATGVERTAVTFHELRVEEIKAYIDTKSPLDKAGAYGIQDAGAIFVKRIDGCFYNVMGFPLASFYQTCRAFLGGGIVSFDFKSG